MWSFDRVQITGREMTKITINQDFGFCVICFLQPLKYSGPKGSVWCMLKINQT